MMNQQNMKVRMVCGANQNAPNVSTHIGVDATSCGLIMSQAVGKPQFIASPNVRW